MGDLFDIFTPRSFNSVSLQNGEEYDYITRTSMNQGILKTTGFIDERGINPSGVWSLGLLQMDFFYRKKPWYASQFMRVIKPRVEIPEKCILFFTTVLNSLKQTLLSVLVRDINEVFKNTVILLPTKDKGIDFAFMETFVAELEAQRVAELEAQRVAELEAYLLTTGLKNYELTQQETKVIENFDKIRWGEYRLGDLFEVLSSKKIFHKNDLSISDIKNDNLLYAYVTRKTQDNGIYGFVAENECYLNDGNTLTFAQDTFTVFYQKEKYFTGNKVKVLRPKIEKFGQNLALYVVTIFNNVLKNMTWGDGSNVSMIKDIVIQLPTKDGEIDFEFMETLVLAVQKLVIEDVVSYADRKIEMTQKVIDGQKIHS